jgi:putative flippase GtrA
MVATLKQWLANPVESIVLQVPRALAASVLALLLDVAILECCIHILNLPAIPAAILGYLAGTVLQFVLCTWWVFAANARQSPLGFLAFLMLSLVGLAVTWFVILIGHEIAALPIELAKTVAVALAFTWNFLSRKYLLFRTSP